MNQASGAGGLCAHCGKAHEELEPAFRRPDAFFAVPEDQRKARVRESDDLVAIDEQAFFIRCVVPIPVTGRDEPYCWGFWVKVSKEHFTEYLEHFDDEPSEGHQGFTGTVANQTRWLAPTLGLPVHVHLSRGKQRPRLMLLDDDHPLTKQQTHGVGEAEVHAWSLAITLDHDERGRKAPARPRFTPRLEVEGWLVATPAQVGREPQPLEAPPRPGDLAKVPFVFLAADAAGNVGERVEFMWVELDEVGADGWFGGTLDDHPFVPGPIDAGSRVWLCAEHLLAFERRDVVTGRVAATDGRAQRSPGKTPDHWWQRLKQLVPAWLGGGSGSEGE